MTSTPVHPNLIEFAQARGYSCQSWPNGQWRIYNRNNENHWRGSHTPEGAWRNFFDDPEGLALKAAWAAEIGKAAGYSCQRDCEIWEDAQTSDEYFWVFFPESTEIVHGTVSEDSEELGWLAFADTPEFAELLAKQVGNNL